MSAHVVANERSAIQIDPGHGRHAYLAPPADDTAVRLTKTSAYDDEAEFELRKRAVGGYWRDGKKFNWVAGEPLPGCHMAGYAFGAGLNGIYFKRRSE